MAARIYINNPYEAKEAILWLEERNLRYKIMREEKAIDSNIRVTRPDMWFNNDDFIAGPEHLNDKDRDMFYPKIRELIIDETDTDAPDFPEDYLVGFVVYNEQEAVEFKLIYG